MFQSFIEKIFLAAQSCHADGGGQGGKTRREAQGVGREGKKTPIAKQAGRGVWVRFFGHMVHGLWSHRLSQNCLDLAARMN
jgi:hypothetical protein